jgi:FkbH-like protein
MSVTYLNLLKQCNALAASSNSKTLRIAIGGNCNADYLLPGLKVSLAQNAIQAEIINLDYASWIQAVQHQQIQADFWVIWISSLGATQGGTAGYSIDFANSINAIQSLINNKAKVVVVLPEKLQISKDFYAPLFREYLHTTNTLLSMLPAEVLLIDPANTHSALGDANWYAARYWSLSKMPCHPNAIAALSLDIGNLIYNCIKPAVNAVIVDLDNTLWGGVVGEDGVENLLLDVNAEGRPFIQMQYFLKYLTQQGIPISVVSKNNLEDAQAPFLERDEMLLKLEDFVYFIANWEAKSINIQHIASKLNLNLDAICFLDDSVYERTQVQTTLPSVIIPELPTDPDERIGMLLDSGLFVTPNLSQEDLDRAQYYKSDVKRDEYLAAVVDLDQYLTGLAMQLEPIAIDSSNMQRVISLINRTNQFNLTNKRHTMPDLTQLLSQPDTFAYCYRLQDKFGDSGIIGVLIAIRTTDTMHIDTFLMSCRVLNRKVEDAIFDHFIAWCNTNAIKTIAAQYVKSAKNILVQDLYSKFGLTIIQKNDHQIEFTTQQFTALQHPITINAIGT